MKELILKVVDEGDFFELQNVYARNIVTGLEESPPEVAA